MQGTLVQSLVQADPTCFRATKPVGGNYWAHSAATTEPLCLERVLHNKMRSYRDEKPGHHDEEQPPLVATRESKHVATKTHSQKINT